MDRDLWWQGQEENEEVRTVATEVVAAQCFPSHLPYHHVTTATVAATHVSEQTELKILIKKHSGITFVMCK